MKLRDIVFRRSKLQEDGTKSGRERCPTRRSKTFHIMTPTLVPGDAVSNDVLGMRDAIKRAGFQCFAYAEHIAPSLAREATLATKVRIDKMERDEDVLVLHHSMFWQIGEDIYTSSRATKIIRYHNVTPSQYFRRYSDDLYNSCEAGRKQTRRLVELGADAFIGDSKFNLEDLKESGADPARFHVVPPFHHADDLLNTPASTSTLEALLDGQINILFVGRFAPNKGHLDLIRTIDYFRRAVEPRARLILVGKYDEQLQTYTEAVQEEIRNRRLQDGVIVLNGATLDNLRAVYLASHIFLCLSEHEGFCVPLIEAMLHKLPIVGLNAAAIPETLGCQSLLADTADEVHLAEMMSYCIQESRFRTWLTNRQYERYLHMFSNDAIAGKLLSVLTPLAQPS